MIQKKYVTKETITKAVTDNSRKLLDETKSAPKENEELDQ